MPDVFNSLLSGWDEIHAFVLGTSFGLLVAVLWRPHRQAALTLLAVSLAVVFAWPTDALEVAVRKPWYFLAALAVLVSLGVATSTGSARKLTVTP